MRNLFFVLLLLPLSIFAQQEQIIYDFADSDPEFEGGPAALHEWIAEHLQYPDEAKKENISGTVYIQFVVLKDGAIEDCKVVRGKHELLDYEALRLVMSMPNWIPGQIDGENVNVKFTLPIRFSSKN